MDRKMMGRCGAYCGTCNWKDKTNCPGCQRAGGNMFWGECSAAKCSIEKGLEHCGHCSQLPCETLNEYFKNEEHGDDGERLANLRGWAKGAETFIELGEFKKNKRF